ncbi:MAG: hypothetical protein HQK49_05645 [Oligoflexia bacterium]|nr:hypothetical protein [Oligoflexia bacterium]
MKINFSILNLIFLISIFITVILFQGCGSKNQSNVDSNSSSNSNKANTPSTTSSVPSSSVSSSSKVYGVKVESVLLKGTITTTNYKTQTSTLALNIVSLNSGNFSISADVNNNFLIDNIIVAKVGDDIGVLEYNIKNGTLSNVVSISIQQITPSPTSPTPTITQIFTAKTYGVPVEDVITDWISRDKITGKQYIGQTTSALLKIKSLTANPFNLSMDMKGNYFINDILVASGSEDLGKLEEKIKTTSLASVVSISIQLTGAIPADQTYGMTIADVGLDGEIYDGYKLSGLFSKAKATYLSFYRKLNVDPYSSTVDNRGNLFFNDIFVAKNSDDLSALLNGIQKSPILLENFAISIQVMIY